MDLRRIVLLGNSGFIGSHLETGFRRAGAERSHRHAAAAQLPLDDLPVGQWAIRVSPLARRKQPLLQCLVAECQQLERDAVPVCSVLYI